MRALAATLPSQLTAGFRAGQELAPPATGRPTTVYVAGMGGSAIAADLVGSIVAAETPVELASIRSPDLPRAVERKSRVVLVSYSGNTWETVRAYEAAGRAGASRFVVASGGQLADRAAHDEVPLLPLPAGLPPRCVVGQVFGSLLGLLDPWFPESNETRVVRAAGRLSRLVPQYASSRGPAASIARRIGSRLPAIYAEASFAGVARRWKTQIEENAKRLAMFDEVPELFHNAIVGWDAISRAEAARFSVVLLRWSAGLATTRRGLDYFERLISQRGTSVTSVPLDAEDRLEATLTGVALGDHVSLALADQRGVDPLPFVAIERMKAALASKKPN
jgi:glucose/mannose-6-phosphate isomerase